MKVQDELQSRQVADLLGRLIHTVDTFSDECDVLTVGVVLNALFTAMLVAATRSENFDPDQFREELMASLKSLTFANYDVGGQHGHA